MYRSVWVLLTVPLGSERTLIVSGRRGWCRNSPRTAQKEQEQEQEQEQERIFGEPIDQEHEDGEKTDRDDGDDNGDDGHLIVLPLFRCGWG